ncbi:MAG: hypothetical protein JEY79_11250 [Pseudodesulfovibrio sp.]|nr:hypothetical protein [Pseudodesulfovibrio sp.]
MAETMDSYRITERAWRLVIERINEMLRKGSSQAEISRLLGVSRPTMSRWMADRSGGDRTTFRHMLRYLDRLRIPLVDVFDIGGEELPPPSPDRAPTELDKSIAATLLVVAKAIGKDAQDVARELETLELPDIKAMLKGQASMRASDLVKLSRAIGVSPGAILERAESLQDIE